MKIMAIDSSGLVASIAVLEEEQMLAEYTINYKKTHSQTLLPMIDEVTQMIELDLDSIDAIAVASGPGSFTGLRIGSATAKGLGLALNKPLISVPTVDALAYNLYGCQKLICPIMDARRSQVYTGLYTFAEDTFSIIMEQIPMGIDQLTQKLNEIGKEVVFLGDGVPVYRSYLVEHLECPYSFAAPHMSRQRAGALGVLAQEYYRAGKIEAAGQHQPDYLRLSQAERERAEKLKNDKN